MSNQRDVNPISSRWDSKYDSSTGKKYLMNYFTRNTSYEDARLRQRQFTEAIPMQDLNGCGLDHTTRLPNHNVGDNQVKTTSMEESVAKISAVFPTAGETHIKTLLLKYLKSVFPVVEETLLLDTLCNSDNNVHHATETLVNMGFDKRATPPPRVSLQKREVDHSIKAEPSFTPRVKTVEEKEKMRVLLKEKHPNTEEKIILLALDSADYNEDKAHLILNMMNDERPVASEAAPEKHTSSITGKIEHNSWDTIVLSATSPEASTPAVAAIHQRQKRKQDLPKLNYVTWIGPNPILAKGPNKTNLGRSLTAWGPDSKLRKGPVAGLAKGSVYSRLSRLTLNEIRGK